MLRLQTLLVQRPSRLAVESYLMVHACRIYGNNSGVENRVWIGDENEVAGATDASRGLLFGCKSYPARLPSADGCGSIITMDQSDVAALCLGHVSLVRKYQTAIQIP